MDRTSTSAPHRGRLGDLGHFIEKDGPRHHLHFLTFGVSRFQFPSEDSLAPIDRVLRPLLLMVPDLLLPFGSTELLNLPEVPIPLFSVLSARDLRARPRRNDDFDLSLRRIPVKGTFIEGFIGGDSET